GHRIRYVSPVRLFVFLSILAFLAAQWSVNFSGDSAIKFDDANHGADSFDDAKSEAAVIAIRDEALAGIDTAKREGGKVPGFAVGMDAAANEVRMEAAARIKELKAQAAASPKKAPAATTNPGPPATLPGPFAPPTPGEDRPPMPELSDDGGPLNFNGKPWDAKTNPVSFGWLPAIANDRLNLWIGRAKVNVERLQKDDDKNWIKDAFLSFVPTVLFALLPLFALLLKAMYLFKRRLYMEHLIVALHSHAFLCLVLLLQSLLALLEGWIAAPAGFVAGLFGWTEGLLWAWVPVYLLLTQKRVYGQGWIVTGLKFAVIGTAYFFMLLFGGLAALFVTLVRT
ncbi:MAG: hypothetical protein ACREO3_04920, partial [Arenimonas sp.]